MVIPLVNLRSIKKEENMIMMSTRGIILIVIPKEVVNVFNLRVSGRQNGFPKQLSALPYKKKRNQFLSDDEKEYNKIHSKMRIIEEHIKSRLKKYRIMSDIFRNKLRRYNKVSDIVAGLVNYRISNQQN